MRDAVIAPNFCPAAARLVMEHPRLLDNRLASFALIGLFQGARTQISSFFMRDFFKNFYHFTVRVHTVRAPRHSISQHDDVKVKFIHPPRQEARVGDCADDGRCTIQSAIVCCEFATSLFLLTLQTVYRRHRRFPNQALAAPSFYLVY